MTVAVIAEKPSVARDIAQVLGARSRGQGSFSGNGYVVTWAVGHLASLAQPHEIQPRWKRWNLNELPMIPHAWPVRVYDKTRDQFDVVQQILCAPDTERIVCATDAGREGELIFRFIYEAAGADKPVQRLWISSLTNQAIEQGFANLRPGSDFDGLADAARGRSQADWLVGMNLSRFYTLHQSNSREVLSVGRVQTPTLAMVVERELAIFNFVSEDYKEVSVIFRPQLDSGTSNPKAPTYQGLYCGGADEPAVPKPTSPKKENEGDSASRATRLPADGEQAAAIAARALAGNANVTSIEGRQRKIPPPLLYDLTELQRHANRLYGNSAKKTLDVAQTLYEKKFLSYPRTDSRALTEDMAQTLPEVVDTIREPFNDLLAAGTGSRPLGRRFIDDSKVGDHHALIPTANRVGPTSLTRDEARIYDLVCRRLLAAWHQNHLYSTTTVITEITQPAHAPAESGLVDRYRSTGTKVDQQGWRMLEAPHPSTEARGGTPARSTPANADQELPTELRENQPQDVLESHVDDKATRPPRRFTEATLLTAMETAGKTVDDKELSQAMRECGLGTPATRAGTIETLLAREYIKRDKKALLATDKGIRLIELVHPHAKSPAMTGQWEAELQRIQDGKGTLNKFTAEIEAFVRDVVASDQQPPPRPPPKRPARQQSIDMRTGTGPSPAVSRPPNHSAIASRAIRPEPPRPVRTAQKPTSPDDLEKLLSTRFGFDAFRPHQEQACRTICSGEDILLVMPTGAGKSLCYQLPGIARAGTTLVVSPLIALMEDQVIKLQQQGFAAERIHSGRSREQSREVCRDYLSGNLDFLFIAPERLSVPGFPEMLGKRKPTLIAIDEAHCISQWGHDFRPDYRMLNERLSLLRPAPIVALTATATPRVQNDIIEQLAAPKAHRFIHGFRRDNIAIEVVEMKPSLRNDTTKRLLSLKERTPAIIYAPTRKKAEQLADELGEAFPTAAYHAGMTPDRRDKVQSAFLSGALDVIVATVAFGMGIDKANVRTVIHLALPASVENYYQEIGRSGRDGKPARAFLLHGFIDRRTHEWFFERDYPDIKLLTKLFSLLSDKPISRDQLQKKAKMDGDTFEKALEKLWIHGGAIVTPNEFATRGPDVWREPYRAQIEHRRGQLEEMARFADTRSCRMQRLVRHFGDQADSGKPCGQCDTCAPNETIAQESIEATSGQIEAMERILKNLATDRAPSSGRLHSELFGTKLDRDQFEILLAALHRAGLVHIEEDQFESDGRKVEFQRPVITTSGRRANADDVANVRIPWSGKSGQRKKRRSSRKKSGARSKAIPKVRTRKSASSPRTAGASPSALAQELRALRLTEAERRGIPAFRIFNDKVLEALSDAMPATSDELMEVKGVGPALTKKYGSRILRVVAGASKK